MRAKQDAPLPLFIPDLSFPRCCCREEAKDSLADNVSLPSPPYPLSAVRSVSVGTHLLITSSRPMPSRLPSSRANDFTWLSRSGLQVGGVSVGSVVSQSY